jgi:type I restriction enzyme S subunit
VFLYLNQRVGAIRLFFESRYINLALKVEVLKDVIFLSATGSANQANIGINNLREWVLPLPPLNEQRRIVAKIDELMVRCDELQRLRGDRDRKQITVHTAALNRLIIAKEQSDFNTTWQFITQHFSELYSVKENVTELRKAILQLAVMGKLVPQDPNDQPASELLKAIKVEKQRLVNEKKIKAQKELPEINSIQVPYELPASWEWCYLDDICTLITDGTHHTPTYTKNGIPFISVKDLSSGELNFSDTRFISDEEHNELIKRCHPEIGDVLLTKVGTTGIAVSINTRIKFSIFVSVALLKLVKNCTDTNYVTKLINSPLVKKYSSDGTEGVGNKNLVLRKIKAFLVPLPPLAEQQRIIAKIDQLMALCDHLEKQIDAANSKQTNLLNAVMTKI